MAYGNNDRILNTLEKARHSHLHGCCHVPLAELQHSNTLNRIQLNMHPNEEWRTEIFVIFQKQKLPKFKIMK